MDRVRRDIDRIQVGARVAESSEALKSYYEGCLVIARSTIEDKKDLENVVTYVDACMQRLDSDPSAFNALREPPAYQMVGGMLASGTDGRITLIG